VIDQGSTLLLLLEI